MLSRQMAARPMMPVNGTLGVGRSVTPVQARLSPVRAETQTGRRAAYVVGDACTRDHGCLLMRMPSGSLTGLSKQRTYVRQRPRETADHRINFFGILKPEWIQLHQKTSGLSISHSSIFSASYTRIFFTV